MEICGHAKRERIALDNERDNDLQSNDWRVLRFNGKQINKQMNTYCLPQIEITINNLRGVKDESLEPRIHYPLPGSSAQQLSLFEEADADYIT